METPTEVVRGGEPDPQARLPLAAPGVQRVVWRMAYGDILIEIRDGVAFVNGERVMPATETSTALSSCPHTASPVEGEADPNTRRGR